VCHLGFVAVADVDLEVRLDAVLVEEPHLAGDIVVPTAPVQHTTILLTHSAKKTKQGRSLIKN